MSVITYNRTPELVIDAQTADHDEIKDELISRVNGIRAKGATNIESAVNMARRQILKQEEGQYINYIMLISDGDPTEGETDETALQDLAHEVVEMGVTIDTVGVGEEFSEAMLRAISQHGGRFHAVSDAHSLEALVPYTVESIRNYLCTNTKISIKLRNEVDAIYQSRELELDYPGKLSSEYGILRNGENVVLITELSVTPLNVTRFPIASVLLTCDIPGTDNWTESIDVFLGTTTDSILIEQGNSMREKALGDSLLSVLTQGVLREAHERAKRGLNQGASQILANWLDPVARIPKQSEDLEHLQQAYSRIHTYYDHIGQGEFAEIEQSMKHDFSCLHAWDCSCRGAQGEHAETCPGHNTSDDYDAHDDRH